MGYSGTSYLELPYVLAFSWYWAKSRVVPSGHSCLLVQKIHLETSDPGILSQPCSVISL